MARGSEDGDVGGLPGWLATNARSTVRLGAVYRGGPLDVGEGDEKPGRGDFDG